MVAPLSTPLDLTAAYTWTGAHSFNAGLSIGSGQGITMAEDGWIGIGASAERIVFDSSEKRIDLYLPDDEEGAAFRVLNSDGSFILDNNTENTDEFNPRFVATAKGTDNRLTLIGRTNNDIGTWAPTVFVSDVDGTGPVSTRPAFQWFNYNTELAHLTSEGHLKLLGDSQTLYFGASSDVNLYRSAANTLKTDDALAVAGELQPYGKINFVNAGLWSAVINDEASPYFLSVDDGTRRVYILSDGYGLHIDNYGVGSNVVEICDAIRAITVTGDVAISGVGTHGLGSIGAPSFAFVTDLDTGMWSSGADTLNFSTGGSERIRVDSKPSQPEALESTRSLG